MDEKKIPFRYLVSEITKDPKTRDEFYSGVSKGVPFVIEHKGKKYLFRSPKSLSAFIRDKETQKIKHKSLLNFLERIKHFKTKEGRNIFVAILAASFLGVVRGEEMYADFPCHCSYCSSSRSVEVVS